MGSTTSVKFKLFSMIRIIANKGEIESNYRDVSPEFFTHLGRLQNAFAMLAHHLDSNEPIPVKFTIDKIVNLRDEQNLEGWMYENLNDICNSIGNLVILDLAKRYNYLQDKYSYYKLSKSKYVRGIITSPIFTFDDWQKRNNHLKQLLADFFSTPKSYDQTSEIGAF